MKDVVVITTFARDHINLYGNNFVESFKRFCNYDLIVFAEDFTVDDLRTPVNVKDFYTCIPEQQEFKDHIKNISKGMRKKPLNRLAKALRWSYKSYAIWYALKNIDTKYIVWLDGDVQCKSPIPYNLIERINEERLMTVYPQAIEGDLHIESGMIIFNRYHHRIDKVIEHYYNGYHNKQVLNIPKPWDGFWLAKLLEDDRAIAKSSVRIRPPFSNVANMLEHNVGKDKFRDTGLNKFSGRK